MQGSHVHNVHMFTNEAEKNKNLLNFLQILDKP